jgi:hypothetical protein
MPRRYRSRFGGLGGGAGRKWQDRAVDPRASAWAASGAMALTGRADGPGLGGPGALVDLVARASGVLNRLAGRDVLVDGLALLGERAALSGLVRQGSTSCGGSTRLVPTADGWLAVSLARPDDVAALPAWLGRDVPAHDPWPVVYEGVSGRTAQGLDQGAALLGLPIAALGSVAAPVEPAFDLPLRAECVRPLDAHQTGRPPTADPMTLAGAVVVDLSSLWAGPLCGQLLAAAGARVIKVESVARPDGARQGPQAFFDLLNGVKRSVALDLGTPDGRHDLERLIRGADVVIESARPRALEQMGIFAADVLRQPTGPRVWASVTSHGRSPALAARVAFGDVAAVAGRLVARDERGPCFLADAVADPLTGLVAAAAISAALAAGGRWLLDAAMAPIAAAAAAGPPLPVGDATPQPPRARPPGRQAPPLGSDTATVLGGLAP